MDEAVIRAESKRSDAFGNTANKGRAREMPYPPGRPNHANKLEGTGNSNSPFWGPRGGRGNGQSMDELIGGSVNYWKN